MGHRVCSRSPGRSLKPCCFSNYFRWLCHELLHESLSCPEMPSYRAECMRLDPRIILHDSECYRLMVLPILNRMRILPSPLFFDRTCNTNVPRVSFVMQLCLNALLRCLHHREKRPFCPSERHINFLSLLTHASRKKIF